MDNAPRDTPVDVDAHGLLRVSLCGADLMFMTWPDSHTAPTLGDWRTEGGARDQSKLRNSLQSAVFNRWLTRRLVELGVQLDPEPKPAPAPRWRKGKDPRMQWMVDHGFEHRAHSWFSGLCRPSEKHLPALAAAFQVPLAELYAATGRTEPDAATTN